jgi:ATP phosphoribosyltransferase regulatory subunit
MGEPDEGVAPEPALLPAGAKDVLPVEAFELREIEARLRSAWRAFGYREVMTPVLEFAEVLDRALEGGLGAAFRLFDDHGRVLALRPDLTIPVARLVATRLADHPGPVRVSYVARVFRPPPPGRAQAAEQRQAGAELVGLAGPAADAEVLALLVEALGRAGLPDPRVAIGDVSLMAAVLDGLDVPSSERDRLRAAAAARNLVAWRRAARGLAFSGPAGDLVSRLLELRGGIEVLERIAAAAPWAEPACARLGATLDLLAGHGAREAAMLDLGVLRDWSYYSGVVFEAYAHGLGAPVAMGGRYDGLAGRFGRPRPAVGFSVMLDLLHRAIAEPEGAASDPAPGVVLVGGLESELAAARAARAAGVAIVALPEGDEAAEAVAAADGWRVVAARAGEGFSVLYRASGQRFACSTLEEAPASRA